MLVFLSTIFIILLVTVPLIFFVVRQQTTVIIERFGKFSRIAQPGLNIKIPFFETIAGKISLKIKQLNVHIETKTQDNVFVKIVCAVQYRAMPSAIYDAFYKLESPAEQIQAFVFDVVRAKVPTILLDDVFARKDDIAKEVKDELKETMADFGHEIIKSLVTDIQPNENVKEAMNEINTAQRLRIAAQEKGEAEKILRVKQAEADAEANILHGKGISGQRQAIMEGLSTSLEEIQKQMPQMNIEKVTDMILMIQYFDMLRELGLGSQTNTVFIPHSPSHATHIADQIRETIFSASHISEQLERMGKKPTSKID